MKNKIFVSVFLVTSLLIPNIVFAITYNVSVLVVGAGGGGGASRGGGGGGGQVVSSSTVVISSGSYAVTIGAKGTGASTSAPGRGLQGGTTTLTLPVPIVATGGGGGGGSIGGVGDPTRGAYGAGGCAGGCTATGNSGSTGIIANQGGNSSDIGNDSAGGGGGGAGASGSNSSGSTAGSGGTGTTSSISGASVTYGCGGGAGANNSNTAGTGGCSTAGAGSNSNTNGNNATANTGSGGGGGGGQEPTSTTATGGDGADGVVVISYPTGTISATGGTITTSGGNTIHTFTTSGTFTVEDNSVIGSGSLNRIAKFTATTTVGNSLLSDDGSNTTLTAGNFFTQISTLFDTVATGTLNFGTTNASTLTFGRSGQNTIINSSKVGIGTSSPTSTLHVIGDIFANFINLAADGLGLDVASTGMLSVGSSTASSIKIGRSGITTTFPGSISFGSAFTTSVCNSTSTPSTCGSAPSGSVAMPTGGSTLVVNTTAVTENSQIMVIEDSSLDSRLGITCNTNTGRRLSISARSSGASFTIKSSANPSGDKACISYLIVN